MMSNSNSPNSPIPSQSSSYNMNLQTLKLDNIPESSFNNNQELATGRLVFDVWLHSIKIVNEKSFQQSELSDDSTESYETSNRCEAAIPTKILRTKIKYPTKKHDLRRKKCLKLKFCFN